MNSSSDHSSVLQKAISIEKDRLNKLIEQYGEFHIEISDVMGRLIQLFSTNGNLDLALPLLHKRLVIHEKHGPDELTACIYHELGIVYRLQQLYDIAEQHLKRSLALREKVYSIKSVQAAETLNSLALLYQCRNEIEKAQALQLQSLEIYHSLVDENALMNIDVSTNDAADLEYLESKSAILDDIETVNDKATSVDDKKQVEVNQKEILVDDSKFLLAGTLEKRCGTVVGSWEPRFFYINPHSCELSYYLSQEDCKDSIVPRGQVHLSCISNILVHQFPENKGQRYRFDVVVDLSHTLSDGFTWEKTFELRCDSRKVVNRWVASLTHFKAKSLRRKQIT